MAQQALPVESKGGMLRIVSAAAMTAAEQAQANADVKTEDVVSSHLADHVRTRMTEMRNFRNSYTGGERLLNALRTYKGEYDPAKLAEIKKFGGSEVFARLTATKCRGATALLRDVYLGPERPWDVAPTPVPEIPKNIDEAINELVKVEVATLQQAGQQIDPQMIADRVALLRHAAEQAAKKVAKEEADRAGMKMQDILVEGRFYTAFAEFLTDLPIFPFACIKGPVVRRVSTIKWVNGKAEKQSVPKMFWYRVSPFDLYWSSTAATVDEAEFVERIRLSRADLLAVRGLPGYNNEAIDAVLEKFSDRGLRDWWDATDQQRAVLENRETGMATTTTGLIDTAEYTGSVQGSTLIEWGMTAEEISDPLQEYRVQAWLIDRFVIKAQLLPTPSQRAPYYITSYEKLPGGLIGSGLPDILDDIQQVSNATVRSLVNNLSIASGPQVVINDQVTQPGEDDSLYPWKRWHVNFDPMISGSQKAIEFFQPNAYGAELMAVFEKFSVLGDEVSALPRYMMGSEKVGGAGRTASGLAMLMGNAGKTLQNVAATIDRDVISPALESLYEMMMLTMPGVFNGDEQIMVKGVNYATKREQDRMRQLEFLQLTGNPIDLQIMGVPGRANILRSVAGQLGLDHEAVVPDEKTLKDQMAQAQAQAQAQPQPPGQPGAPDSNQMPKPEADRAGPEQARRPVESEFTNGATGRPGMRAGG